MGARPHRLGGRRRLRGGPLGAARRRHRPRLRRRQVPLRGLPARARPSRLPPLRPRRGLLHHRRWHPGRSAHGVRATARADAPGGRHHHGVPVHGRAPGPVRCRRRGPTQDTPPQPQAQGGLQLAGARRRCGPLAGARWRRRQLAGVRRLRVPLAVARPPRGGAAAAWPGAGDREARVGVKRQSLRERAGRVGFLDLGFQD
jgi:hypothetical protein